MQMALVYVGSQHIGIFTLQHFVGKLPPDLVGLLRRGFARLKGLYQMVGQIVSFVERLIYCLLYTSSPENKIAPAMIAT